LTDRPSPPDWWHLNNNEAWQAWREQYQAHAAICYEPVDLHNLNQLRDVELQEIRRRVCASGVALYRSEPDPGENALLAFGAQLGLHRVDHHQCAEASGVAHLNARDDAAARFIPYTRKRLRWHTDGYYQDETAKIHSFLLHCAMPAQDGGANRLLDPRALYIALREEDPAYIEMLSRPEIFTVPPYQEDGIVQRPAYSGTVFSLDEDQLYMRYTERSVHIRWQPEAEAALTRIRELLESLPQAMHELKLEPGCGLIAHNVLHCRSAYTNVPESPRLLYRIRYHDRVSPSC